MTEVQKVNILMVDDRPKNLLALGAVLTCNHYNLVSALSGEEALKCVLKDDFAVILLDVQMPGLNGFDTAKLIRTREKTKHIPIIFITAISQTREHEQHGYSVGAIDYIFKPFHPETLKSKVKNLVQLYQHQKQIEMQNTLLNESKQKLESAYEQLTRITKELRQTEALARVIGETSLDAIITCHHSGMILNVNPAALAIFGYKRKQFVEMNISTMLPAIQHDETLLFNPIIQNYKNRIWESKAVKADGTRFPADIQIGEASLDQRNIYVFSIRDISERKQIEEERKLQYLHLEHLVEKRTQELSQSKNQIETILKSITDGFFAVDQDWKFTFVNPKAEQILQKTRENLIGKSFWSEFPQATTLTNGMLHKALDECKPVHYEVYSSVTQSWNEVHAYPSTEGISVYFSDITTRKQMELDLRSSQERFHKIFQSSPSLISIRSINDGLILDVNESWLTNSGYHYDEVVGSSSDFLEIKLESDKPNTPLQHADLLNSLRNVNISYTTKFGEIRSGLLSTELIEIQDSKCVLCVVTDITNRVLLEKEIARLDRLHLIGEMAAGIAHEIRNPMTTVRGFLQMSKVNPHSEYVDLMLEELDRANSIITEFLTLAKNKTTHRKPHSLNEIIKAIYPLIQAEAMLADKYVDIILGNCPDLLLDEKEIRQLILNLALNGLEAMDAGGMLRIKTSVKNQEVILEVSDQGSGIHDDYLEKIWTPFFTTKETGTGLGLAVCYSVASRHDAQITVKSCEKGTTFYVHFNATYADNVI